MKDENEEEDFDLISLIKILIDRRKFILIFTAVFIVLGLFVAFYSPKVYTASSTFVRQLSSGSRSQGGLSGLASLAGVNLNQPSANDEISPTLLPKMIASPEFLREIMKTELSLDRSGQTRVSYEEYYDKHHKTALLGKVKKYTLGLPSLIIQSFKKRATIDTTNYTKESELIFITPQEEQHFGRITGQLSVVPNILEGYTEVSYSMPNAWMSAEMAKSAIKLLEQRVIDYKIQNALVQLNFTEERMQERKIDYEEKQLKLSKFLDQNLGISSAVSSNQTQKLRSEFDLAFSIYSDLVKQVEQAKIQVSRDTPVFSIIKPVTVPTKKSKPMKFFILMSYLMTGIILSISTVFIREFVIGLRSKMR
ncbi:MAG: LPS O-antigen subunit length determinant protein (WzzB/FepE family) [Parvicella sp.]|jgi:LPS O-antigen subunit length determinant protein (WzzB/FepE family)